MPKNSVADWSTTASDNTDIAGIGIQGTNAVNNFDDALRTMMAQIRTSIALKVSSSTDNAIVRFDGTSGQQQNSNVTIGDTGTITNVHTAVTGYQQSTSDAAGASVMTAQNSSGKGLEFTTYSVSYASGTRFSVGAGNAAITSDNTLAVGTLAGEVRFYTAGTYTGRWTASGFLLVGATSESTSTAEAGVQLNPAGDVRSKMTGTTTNVHVRFFNNAGVTPTLVGSISSSGSATTYATSSDQRLKENFQSFDSGAIIDAINTYRYTWKVDKSIGYGVKAQELQSVFPSAVLAGSAAAPGSEDFIPWSADYTKLVPVLLHEVKLLRQRVAALEA